MRAQEGEQRFAEFLIQLGNGELALKENNPYECSIEIPRECILGGQNQDSCEEIIDSVFGNFEGDVFKKVILTPTNLDALNVNEKILTRLPGDATTCLSFDSIVSDSEEEIALYPLEFLNRAIQQNAIDVEIFTGVHAGKRRFIPRVTLAPADTGRGAKSDDLTFTWCTLLHVLKVNLEKC
ncbi:uncharacterized protein [Clytia hemisphaerica]|uniref:uncharacterized protein n=1 Tax=Clytia hemisphaerica TaxID=252671 RepID=UPI0034D70AFB